MPSGAQLFLQNTDEGIVFHVLSGVGAIYPLNDSSTLYIANFEMIGVSSSTLTSNISSNVNAYECAMWMCVQAYDTSMTASSQSQVVVQNHSRINETRSGWAFTSLPAIMNPIPGAYNYSVSQIVRDGLEDWFWPLFDGSLRLSSGRFISNSDVTQAIWNATDTLASMNTLIQSLASSMTNAIRSTNLNETYYHGTAFHLGYEVHWAWITLPAALVIMSLLILTITIFETARSPVQAWKGSPLALLFMGIDSDVHRRAAGQMALYNGIENSVGKTKVALKNYEEGKWGLKAL